MNTYTIAYQEGLRCVLTHDDSGSQIETDAPKDNHGNGARFSPTDLATASLGACALTVMNIAAKQMGIELLGATAVVKKVMSAELPRRIVGMQVAFTIPKGEISEAQMAKLEQVGRNCPVSLSLHPDLKQDMTFNWV